MSGLLQIRGVPEEVRRALKARAAAQGKSLNAYLLEIIDREVARPTVEEVLARAERRAEVAECSSLDIIRSTRAERDEQVQGRTGA